MKNGYRYRKKNPPTCRHQEQRLVHCLLKMPPLCWLGGVLGNQNVDIAGRSELISWPCLYHYGAVGWM